MQRMMTLSPLSTSGSSVLKTMLISQESVLLAIALVRLDRRLKWLPDVAQESWYVKGSMRLQ